MGEIWDGLPRVAVSAAQQTVAAQPVERSRVQLAREVYGRAVGQVTCRQPKHCLLAGIRQASVLLAMLPNQPGPDLAHGIGIAQRRSRKLASNEQVDDDKAPHQLARPRVAEQAIQRWKAGRDLIELCVVEGLDDVTGWRCAVEPARDDVVNDLPPFIRRHGNDPNVARTCRLDQSGPGGGPRQRLRPGGQEREPRAAND